VISVLGISAFYHDSASCIVVNGKILAAAQEKKIIRINMNLIGFIKLIQLG
tara:strand:+ start:2629 stop:2781 length:153 start_codon:yes stop_codon:yes gene_type:complete